MCMANIFIMYKYCGELSPGDPHVGLSKASEFKRLPEHIVSDIEP